MIDLKEFRRNADKDNLCSEYTNLWNNANSSKDLMDLAMGVKGADYICDSIAKGWGISPEIIASRFKYMINGKYKSEQRGYASALYCLFNGSILVDSTLLILIDCQVDVTVPKNMSCEIYATGNTNILLEGEGDVVVIAYGKPENVVVEVEDKNIHYKRLQKKEKDRHE